MAAVSKGDHNGTYEVIVTFDPASAASVSAVPQSITVAGVDPSTDTCLAVEPQSALAAGLALGACRVSAVNTVTVPFINPTAGAVDQASMNFKVVLARH
jgi:hypothetical protein